jgi:hypothetical protein
VPKVENREQLLAGAAAAQEESFLIFEGDGFDA